MLPSWASTAGAVSANLAPVGGNAKKIATKPCNLPDDGSRSRMYVDQDCAGPGEARRNRPAGGTDRPTWASPDYSGSSDRGICSCTVREPGPSCERFRENWRHGGCGAGQGGRIRYFFLPFIFNLAMSRVAVVSLSDLLGELSHCH